MHFTKIVATSCLLTLSLFSQPTYAESVVVVDDGQNVSLSEIMVVDRGSLWFTMDFMDPEPTVVFRLRLGYGVSSFRFGATLFSFSCTYPEGSGYQLSKETGPEFAKWMADQIGSAPVFHSRAIALEYVDRHSKDGVLCEN